MTNMFIKACLLRAHKNAFKAINFHSGSENNPVYLRAFLSYSASVTEAMELH